MAIIESGNSSAGKANVDAAFNLNVTLPKDDESVGKGGAVAIMDDGAVTGVTETRSIDVDEDYKLRINAESLIDQETFDYSAQNTGKHSYTTTTLTMVWAANGLRTNGGGITTINTGALFRTYAMFPVMGATQLWIETEGSFDAQPTTNTLIDFGGMIPGAANPFTPGDGIYFRLNSNGIVGVINSNGTETQVGPFDFTNISGAPSYANNRKYQWIIQVTQRRVNFWIDNILVGSIETPVGQGQPCMAAALNFAVRHAIVGGAAGAALSFYMNSYTVSLGGSPFAETIGCQGNRALGSYQGLSGGTMGSLANYANSANPAGAAGSNTAANVTGLGGQGAINAAAAAATDFIMCSYQVPVGTVNVQGRRLRINGVKVSFCNLGAVVASSATTLAVSIAFGHTAVSLATAEAATAKAPRRIPLGYAFWPVGAVVGQTPSGGDITMKFDNPIFVNPGEFVALAMKFAAGTATASQVIHYHVTFDFGWE